MDRKIKLIWDFRGPVAAKTSEHHQKHLEEYIGIEKITMSITGHEHLSDMHSTAFMIVPESMMKSVRDALKPHRGEVYEK